MCCDWIEEIFFVALSVWERVSERTFHSKSSQCHSPHLALFRVKHSCIHIFDQWTHVLSVFLNLALALARLLNIWILSYLLGKFSQKWYLFLNHFSLSHSVSSFTFIFFLLLSVFIIFNSHYGYKRQKCFERRLWNDFCQFSALGKKTSNSLTWEFHFHVKMELISANGIRNTKRRWVFISSSSP